MGLEKSRSSTGLEGPSVQGSQGGPVSQRSAQLFDPRRGQLLIGNQKLLGFRLREALLERKQVVALEGDQLAGGSVQEGGSKTGAAGGNRGEEIVGSGLQRIFVKHRARGDDSR